MQIEIGFRPSQSMAHVMLQPGESVMAESGAMVGMSTNVRRASSAGADRSEASITCSAASEKATSQSPNDQLIVGAFGGIQELQCDGRIVIDTGHLVAWDANLQYKVTKSGSGWINSFLSGEGLVCDFEGQGRIWIQTRNPVEYGTSIGRLLPPRQG